MRRVRQGALDTRAAEAALAVVGDRVRPGRDGALWPLEADVRAAVGTRLENPGLIALAIAHLDAAGEGGAARRAEPVPRAGLERHARHERMVVSLDHDQCVARGVLSGDVPGLLGVSAAAADPETGALAQGVERQPAVRPQGLAVSRLDRARRCGQIAAEELAERALTDETDAGAVGLVEHRQARAPGPLAHRGLTELAERHENGGQLARVHRVQEIALVLGRIARLAERGAIGLRHETRVMAGREALRAEAPRVVERHAELDLPVAQH